MLCEHFDVLIIGAGLSGIGAACSLKSNCPQKTFAILEARNSIGGTWDLFRYPGIRSDSDMYTLGYSFRPWREPDALADGASILKYVQDTAAEHQLHARIRFGQRVIRASWSSADASWSVEVDRSHSHDTGHDTVRYTCNFLLACTGYYNYAQGYTPSFAGLSRFEGKIVHPQHWPQDLSYAGKHVIVIGSGATAVTLVPAIASSAAHVTMLQRSPTYVVSVPRRNQSSSFYRFARWRSLLFGMTFFQLCKRFPSAVRRFILNAARAQLGPDYDIAAHFAPRYNPWEQRMCLAPDGDFFRAISSGRASVRTGEIDIFTQRGIRLRNGDELQADLVVTATGLERLLLGAIQISVDGRPVDFSRTITYKGALYSGVPNLASAFGYTNASWTLRSELTCEYVCRLLNHMQRTGYQYCLPKLDDRIVQPKTWLNLKSGYIERSAAHWPKQGSRGPWRLPQNYLLDLAALRFSPVDDGVLQFCAARGRA
jgi:monooxygenase